MGKLSGGDEPASLTGALAWPSGPETPRLERDQIHVWMARLGASPGPIELSRMLSMLSREERARANRFRFDRDRHRFIAARSRLRILLGRYLERAPASLRFRYRERGKPFLPEFSGVFFNLSHSRDLALCAFTSKGEVGIDVEYVRVVRGRAIAARFFSEREAACLSALPPESRREAFFLCWTRKEAYLKALGEGFSRSLKSFSVSCDPGAPARMLDPELSHWQVVSLEPAAGFRAAVVAEGSYQLRCWELELDSENEDPWEVGRR